MKAKPLDERIKQECRLINKIYPLGWTPKGKFIFEKNGYLYDLSAADIAQLDRIEKEGSFRI